jgi:hypothetical protein
MPPRDPDPLATAAGTWHDMRQEVLGMWGTPPAPARGAAEHQSAIRAELGPQPPAGASRAPDGPELRRLRRAMAEAASWEELFRLSQRIWDCPVIRDANGRKSARAQLCIAHTRAVERLWRQLPSRRGCQRTTGTPIDGDVAVHPDAHHSAALLPAPTPAPRSLAGSRVPPPPPVKAERLRRAHGAALTAAAPPAPVPAIGAGGGPPHGATT